MSRARPKSIDKATEPTAPPDLRKALAALPAAEAAWRALTPVARRDFISWINQAKQAETRSRRIERAGENLAAGKRRPCCYAVVPLDLYTALNAAAKAKARWSELTSDERRDFVEWIESAKEAGAVGGGEGKEKRAAAKLERKNRIGQSCAMLAAGRRSPVRGAPRDRRA